MRGTRVPGTGVPPRALRNLPLFVQESDHTERPHREKSVTNTQLYLAIGVPILANAAMFGLLIAYMNARFAAIDTRFADLKDLWRAELHRVEEVLDPRLKHLEER